MSKSPVPPPGSVSFWTGAALVSFDGRDLVINRPHGPIKGVMSYPVDQIAGIQITKPPLGLHVFRVLVAGESTPRGRQGMLEITKDPFAVQFAGKHRAEAEAVAAAVRQAQDALRRPQPVQQAALAAPAGVTEQLTQLAALHASGALTDAEFAAAKARLLGTGAPQDQPPRAW